MRNKVAAAAEAAAAALGGAAAAPPTHGGSKTVEKIQSIAAGAHRQRRVLKRSCTSSPLRAVQIPCWALLMATAEGGAMCRRLSLFLRNAQGGCA